MEFEITTIFGIFISFVLVAVLTWLIGGQKSSLFSYRLFDLAILSLFSSIFLARVLGLIIFHQGLPDEWSILPVTQPDLQIQYFQTWPWVFFKITDGRFLFLEMFSGFAIAEVFFIILNGRRVQVTKILDARFTAFAVAMLSIIPFFLLARFNNYLNGVVQPVYFLLLILINAVIALLIINLQNDNQKRRIVIVLGQFLTIGLFNLLYAGKESIVFINLILLAIATLHALRYILEVIVTSMDKKAESKRNTHNYRPPRDYSY